MDFRMSGICVLDVHHHTSFGSLCVGRGMKEVEGVTIFYDFLRSFFTFLHVLRLQNQYHAELQPTEHQRRYEHPQHERSRLRSNVAKSHTVVIYSIRQSRVTAPSNDEIFSSVTQNFRFLCPKKAISPNFTRLWRGNCLMGQD